MPLYDSESGDITMMLTGESLISRRMSVFKEPSYLKMVKQIHSGHRQAVNIPHGHT